MKRWIIWFSTFFLAIGLGIASAGLFLAKRYENESPSPNVLISPNAPTLANEDDSSFETIEEVNVDLIEPSPKLKIIETGDSFHGDEMPARNGETWLGFYATTETAEVKNSRLIVKKVHDDIVDDSPSAKTGKLVSVRGDSDPLFLLKGPSSIRPGVVTSIFRGKTWPEAYRDAPDDVAPIEVVTVLDKNFRKRFQLGGIDYELKVIRAVTPDRSPILALVLETESLRQVIHTMRTSYEGERGDADWLGMTGTLFWIGDLDNDNKPDLYLDLFVHENVSNSVLLMSTKTKKGQLVGVAGQFWTTGC